MKIKNILILTFIFTGLFSCDSELEEEIFSVYSASNFFQNEEQLQSQNIGIYEAFRHVLWEQDMYFLTSMTSKYATSRVAGIAIHAAYATVDQQPFRYERIWNVGFSAISRANTVIKNAPLTDFYQDNTDLVNQYIAEAKWMRAYTYFQLTQLFGDLPLYTEPVESADPEILFKSRSSKEDIYNQIIEDLEFAKNNLPISWSKTGSGRVTKAGGAFLLGKVYLTSAGHPLQITENYQKAIDILKPLADTPDDYGVELLSDWKSIFSINNEGNKEVIFAHGNIYENLKGSVLPFWTNPQFSEFGGIQNNNVGSSYQLAWHPDLLDLYETDDIRLQDGFTHTYTQINNGVTRTYSKTPLNATGTNYAGRNGICGSKYQDGGATGNVIHSKDHIVYRYVDAFLMLAEAYNENNEPGKALPYLKIARDRVNASEITINDQSSLRTVIREERIRELYSEMGELFDVRRWDITEEEYNQHRLRQWRNPNKSWDEKFKLSPIPNIEIGKNPNLLPQNTGW